MAKQENLADNMANMNDVADKLVHGGLHAEKWDAEGIAHNILHVVTEYVALEKQIKYYDTDVPIYNAEIHIIAAIAANPGIHIKGLAEKFDITSASVSEMVSKLRRKGLVEKKTDKSNLSRLNLSLTEKGRTAYQAHERYHKRLHDLVADRLEGASPEQVAFLRNFLVDMADMFRHFV